MERLVYCAVLVAVLTLSTAKDIGEHSTKSRKTRSASDVWHKFARGLQQRTFECKKMHEDCHGSVFDRCCGDMICYREQELDLFDIFDEGYCVECLDHGQICQRDDHCCGNLVCIKDKIYSINGLCEPKLGRGGHCHSDDECESGECDFGFLHGSCE